jgi:hypothetical protein
MSTPALEATKSPVQWVPGYFPGEKKPLPRLRMSGAIPLLPLRLHGMGRKNITFETRLIQQVKISFHYLFSFRKHTYVYALLRIVN